MKEWERALERFTKWHRDDSGTKGQCLTPPATSHINQACDYTNQSEEEIAIGNSGGEFGYQTFNTNVVILVVGALVFLGISYVVGFSVT